MGISQLLKQVVAYKYFFITCDYDPRNVVLKPIFRDKSRNRIYCEVDDFEPYFYIPQEEADTIPEDNYRIKRIEYTELISKYFVSLQYVETVPVIRIIVKRPEHVPHLRERFDRTFEADVLFVKRFLIDTGIWIYGIARKQLLPGEINHLSWTDFLPEDSPQLKQMEVIEG